VLKFTRPISLKSFLKETKMKETKKMKIFAPTLASVLDPDPDPLVRGMDPDPALDPDPSIIIQK
jgi:hypothetical protein